jgi:hypothetical protein
MSDQLRLDGAPERDRLTHAVKVKGEVVQVILTGASFECTKCGAVKPGSEFGLRVMPGAIIRNQPQCIPCRGER